MKINPDHPVTQQMEGQWYKLLAILMLRYGLTEFEVTIENVDKMAAFLEDGAIVADCRGGGLMVRLVPMAEALKLAGTPGGTA